MKIAVWGYGRPVIETIKILHDSRIDISYVKSDYERNDIEQFEADLKAIGVSNLYVNDIPNIDVDLIFTKT